MDTEGSLPCPQNPAIGPCLKESVRVWGALKHFVTSLFYGEGFLPHAQPLKLYDHSVSSCSWTF